MSRESRIEEDAEAPEGDALEQERSPGEDAPDPHRRAGPTPEQERTVERG